MVTQFGWLALALLFLGVLGSVLPFVPGGLSSLAGVLLYWWSTGYADPGPLVLAGFVVVALVAVAVEYLGGAIAARAGGTPARTAALASLAGVLLGIVAGPLGLLVGVAGAVFLLEFVRERDAGRGAARALYATAGVLASTGVQVLLTGGMLAAFVLVLLL